MGDRPPGEPDALSTPGGPGGALPDPAPPAPSPDLLVAGLLILAVEAAARFLLAGPWKGGMAGRGISPEAGTFLFTAALRSLQAGLAVAYLLLRRRRWRSLGLSSAGAGRAACLGLAIAAIGAAGIGAWALARVAFPDLPAGSEILGGAFPRAPGLPTAAAAFLAVAVVGPLAEEIAFRGILFRALRKPAGFLPTLLASSLLFAAAHAGGPAPWPWYLAGGLIFGMLLEKTGSLWGPIAAHAAGNAVLLGAAMGGA
jgi:membrane protease YdiL (CAAX protease family)